MYIVLTLVLVGSLAVAVPSAFGDFVVPVPSECASAGLTGTETHTLSSFISGTSVSGTFTINPRLPTGVVFGEVKFVLDPGPGSSTLTVFSPLGGPFPYSFTGLSSGPHKVVACVEFHIPGVPLFTTHTDVTTFTISSSPVGGTIVPVDMTTLFVAGMMTNAFWMVPTLGGVAGAAIALFRVKRRHN